MLCFILVTRASHAALNSGDPAVLSRPHDHGRVPRGAAGPYSVVCCSILYYTIAQYSVVSYSTV